MRFTGHGIRRAQPWHPNKDSKYFERSGGGISLVENRFETKC